MQNHLLIASLFTCLVSPGFAAIIDNPPETCPDISAVSSVGFHHAELSNYGWFTWETNRYNTNDEWTFVVWATEAEPDTEEQALDLFNENITSLYFYSGPDPVENNPGQWACMYMNSDYTYLGMAFTPQITNAINRMYRNFGHIIKGK